MLETVYSTNEEEFYDYDYILDDLKDLGHTTGDTVEIYQGDAIPMKHSNFIFPDHIIESIQEWAYDEVGDYAEGYLEGLTDADKKELEELIEEFLVKKTGQPNLNAIKNIKRVEATVE